jgi:hypothetical protein
MKLILAALKIDQRGSAPPPTVARAEDTSSSADNVEKGCRGDSGGDKMKEMCTDVMLAKNVSNS